MRHVLVVLLLVASVYLPAPVAAEPEDAMLFGFDADKGALARSLGIPVQYGQLWILYHHTRAQMEAEIQKANDNNVTPVILWYYYGDAIDATCFDWDLACEHCWGSNCHTFTKAEWDQKASDLADAIQAKRQGQPSIVVLEPEFNKHGVETLESVDGYLAEQARIFKTRVQNVEVVVGFGGWGYDHWPTFDQAVAESDMLGTQALHSSYRQSPEEYDATFSTLLESVRQLNLRFGYGRDVIVYDYALSSWTNPEHQVPPDYYLSKQAEEVREFFDRIGEFKAENVRAFLYRRLVDCPTCQDPAVDYHAEAELYWAIRDKDNAPKPAFEEFRRGVERESACASGCHPVPTLPTLSRVFEAEDFTRTAVGGRFEDAARSGGAGWNVWATGAIEQDARADHSASYLATVVAAADLAGAAPPRMELYVNDVKVKEWDVTSTSYYEYGVRVRVPQGPVTFRVNFTNDYQGPEGDRNLRVDYLRLDTLPARMAYHEAEAFASRPVGGEVVDTSASGGRHWNLWSDGAIAHTVYTDGGPHEFRVLARGDPADGWPIMRLKLDGSPIATWTVDSATWKSYVAVRDVAPGAHSLEIEFTNDYMDLEGDRNLRVDAVEIRMVETMWHAEAENFPTVTAGSRQAYDDPSAGASWALWTNGHLASPFTLPRSVDQEIVIVARGDAAGGVWPLMRVEVDGYVVAETYVTTSGWASYRIPISIPPGDHTLAVHFLNDGQVLTEDRNLKLDVVSIHPGPVLRWVQEAEDFESRPVGQESPDPVASGSAFWYLWANGEISTTLSTSTAGAHEVRIVASGDVADGVWPIMRVRVGDQTLGEVVVDSALYRTYTFPVDLSGGAHTVGVEFLNDHLSGQEDRNLKVDVVTLWAHAG